VSSVITCEQLCLSHPFSRIKWIRQWAVDRDPVLNSTTSAKIGKTAIPFKNQGSPFNNHCKAVFSTVSTHKTFRGVFQNCRTATCGSFFDGRENTKAKQNPHEWTQQVVSCRTGVLSTESNTWVRQHGQERVVRVFVLERAKRPILRSNRRQRHFQASYPGQPAKTTIEAPDAKRQRTLPALAPPPRGPLDSEGHARRRARWVGVRAGVRCLMGHANSGRRQSSSGRWLLC